MKNLSKILGLICITTMVVLNSQADALLAYKITGEFIFIEPAGDEEPSEPEAPPRAPIDLSSAVLTISFETTNEEGAAETVTLYEGRYEEDFENVGEIAEPTEIKLSLQVSENSNPMTIKSVVGTGSDVHFAYIDLVGPRDLFALVSTTNQVVNPDNKFSVSGDLSFLDDDPTKSRTVEISAVVYDDEGNRQGKRWGPVFVKDNTFLIEGDVGRPTKAKMFIRSGDNSHSTIATVMIEPLSDFVVGKLGDQIQELSVTSGSGYHAKLIESWQQSEEYIHRIEAYANEYHQYNKRRETGEPEPKVAEEEVTEKTDNDSKDNTDAAAPAEGCEDAVVQEIDIPDLSFSPPKYISLRENARDFRNEILQEIVEGDNDRWARFFAINMSPYDVLDYASQLAAWRSMATEFSDKFVVANITPYIEVLETTLASIENDEKLIPGQKVPEFTLAHYDGEDRSLYSLLADNDMVLIDFWASWCGPCIADFPELKKLYAAYTDEGFEIVGVAVLDTKEDWKGSVAEHELPWINLGETDEPEGPVATLYGVSAIPKGFLVDSQGCIYKKNIRPAALKEFLVDRYGMDESLEEADEKSEDTPDVSG